LPKEGYVVAQLVEKVAGSIPDGVFGIFYSYNPSGRTMALGLTQAITEMSNRNNSSG
jgi:hypothetical protein